MQLSVLFKGKAPAAQAMKALRECSPQARSLSATELQSILVAGAALLVGSFPERMAKELAQRLQAEGFQVLQVRKNGA